MRVLYDIQDMLEDEMRKICKQDSLTGSDLDELFKMVDIVKDITTIHAMEKSEYGDGCSDTYKYTSRGSSYEGGYRGHESKEQLLSKLKDMMHDAHTEDERESYRRAIESLNRS